MTANFLPEKSVDFFWSPTYKNENDERESVHLKEERRGADRHLENLVAKNTGKNAIGHYLFPVIDGQFIPEKGNDKPADKFG